LCVPFPEQEEGNGLPEEARRVKEGGQGGQAGGWLPGQGLAQGLRITIGTGDQMNDIAAILRELAEKAR